MRILDENDAVVTGRDRVYRLVGVIAHARRPRCNSWIPAKSRITVVLRRSHQRMKGWDTGVVTRNGVVVLPAPPDSEALTKPRNIVFAPITNGWAGTARWHGGFCHAPHRPERCTSPSPIPDTMAYVWGIHNIQVTNRKVIFLPVTNGTAGMTLRATALDRIQLSR